MITADVAPKWNQPRSFGGATGLVGGVTGLLIGLLTSASFRREALFQSGQCDQVGARYRHDTISRC